MLPQGSMDVERKDDGSESYFKKGDTAVIVFDVFASSKEGWSDFFEGKASVPRRQR